MSKKAVNRQRVLVVDDDPETRESVGEALEQAGFDPTLAATGEQGLVLLREWPCRIDWLYTKAELPGLVDGWILADEFPHKAFAARFRARALWCAPTSGGKPSLREEASPWGTPVSGLEGGGGPF